MTQALQIDNLKKIYEDGFTALKGISLTVEQGDFFALLGPNGAGKSTTIGIITSLVRKTEGNVSVMGYDIDTQLRQAQANLGIVPQEFNFNVYENVEDIIYNQAGFYGLARATVKHQVKYYLKKLDLWSVRNKPAGKLSGGMKRRLMIARAMIHEPKLLILDEPTAGVDLEIRLAMWEFIQDINQHLGTTVILTTHYLEEAEQLCRNVAIINHGEIIKQTSMKNLLSQLDKETIVLDVVYSDNKKPTNLKNEITRQIDDNTLEIDIRKGTSITAAFSELEKKGVTIKSIRNKANRLESLFLDLVKRGEQ